MLLFSGTGRNVRSICWKIRTSRIKSSYCTHKIPNEMTTSRQYQPQRRLNPKVQDVVKNEIVKLLDSKLIYLISDSLWVSPIHVVLKKGGMTVVLNNNNELIPSPTVTGWRVCIDYRKLNDATRKDHFPLPFIDQMLERLCGNEYYCFLDGFSGFFQILIAPEDQEKTTFTCDFCLPMNAIWIMQRTSYFLKMHDGNFPRHGGRLYGSIYGRLLSIRCFGTTNRWKFKPIYYASKTLNNAQEHYTTTEKELLAVVFSFDKFRRYLILSKIVVYIDHSTLKYLFSKQDAKPRLIRRILLLQGVNIEIKDKKGAENLGADHLSRLENPYLGAFTEEEIPPF
ncbi:reverse transcriptase domain-containing protein [Tanacetum coccineum]